MIFLVVKKGDLILRMPVCSVTYFEESDQQMDLLTLEVHICAVIQLLPEVLHEPSVARLPKHSLRRRAPLLQQQQQVLMGARCSE